MSIVDLLVSDAEDLVLGALLGPQWGIYLNGSPVIQPASIATSIDGLDTAVTALAELASVASAIGVISPVSLGNIAPAVASTIDFEYAQDWPVSNYPQEQGAFQAYNKVTLPYDIKIKLAGGGSQPARQAFLQACLAIAQSFTPFDIVTPEMVFPSCTVTHVDWPRNAKQGNTLISVTLYFQQVPVINSTTYENTQQPGDASPQGIGNVQPQTPNQYVQNSFAAGGWQVQ